ncbi:5-methylcytosine-specific restriction enzyme A [Mesoplasma florum W37]|uniref:HNH domain-containing protein n=1 Tax=Mesoplasma florum TaxID=2151 RepID=A0AAD2JE82_MESFO|nr:HNH endonuclease signature motif containing protein [Mesoplasma florum]AGY41396.1 5-methylcytosine-specific restriction enzyme A [Mesoplasma florum W37]AVN59616.1 HNH endonuclease [Mesoplasma florum]AVN65736.1 hypothetical protein MflW12_3310 [Mesoplasma florum]
MWQAPGNSKIFDEDINENIKEGSITERTIKVLQFFASQPFYDYSKVNDLTEKMKDFLIANMKSFKPNKTTLSHFYKPLIFYEFVNVFNLAGQPKISISATGRQFLKNYNEKKYNNAKMIFFQSTLQTRFFANSATIKSQNEKIFPFRMIYFLLIKNKKININDFENKLVYITCEKDFENFEKGNIYFKSTEKAKKWKAWVISSLLDIKIFVKEKNYIFLNDEYKIWLEKNIELNKEYFIMDFDFDIDERFKKIKSKRNRKLAVESYIKANWKCELNEEHFSFTTNKNKMFLESHHIIPFSHQNLYEQQLDCKENLIALCPNCHRSFHHSTNKNKIKLIDVAYNLKENELLKINFNKDDLYAIYLR